ncbi:MAG: crossover junction endodeoxyribonuclease RuvC [Candidatus Moranbacteria bacterium]|nr:crossover junction endodeoxyribonuclease RuvC [Candidatus Moranbacteria bacterium]
MRILGIDPGTATVGWGVIDIKTGAPTIVASGHISTPKEMPLSQRLLEISRDIKEILETYRPSEAGVEELFFFKNQKTVISVAQARGAILLTLEENSVSIFGYTPLQVKQALTNYGRADKTQVQQMVKALLKLKEIPKPDDTADALAIALCHAQRRRREIIENIN